ncbi:uncharacterized protein PgNI_04507 [Pyricularia grisea]|uniref:Tudor domain-containing protein n=1 Tax=Pyricularia grisea TaxID=148305 RepID=A0A6P8B9X7_PYRGI|nr:uncharacterized protein PgNI_04507 [Pyricularia grisea]TLD12477.1 hypothetical protein PgNI_04507 [Pyricularia grisea]
MSIAQFEEDKAQYVEQLEIVLSSLKDDPDSVELQALKDELESAISMIEESIAELRPKKTQQQQQAPPPPPKAASPPPQPEKWRKEDHPAFKKAAAPEPAAPPPPPAAEEFQPDITYQVNDNVLAKWLSGDKGFYPARITSVTGSSSARMYTVKFKSYGTVETLRSRDIKPVTAPAQKRKADGTPVNAGGAAATPPPPSGSPLPPSEPFGGDASQPPPPPPPSAAAMRNSSGVVLSASPSLYPQKPQDGGEGAADAKPVKKFKKIKATKELEAGKNKWQDFNAKSKFGKSQKKDSMFRTPEGVHGRVGFTGSGQAMRKDASRSRHIYQPNEDAD